MNDNILDQLERWLAGGESRTITLVGCAGALPRWIAGRVEGQIITQHYGTTPAEALTDLVESL